MLFRDVVRQILELQICERVGRTEGASLAKEAGYQQYRCFTEWILLERLANANNHKCIE